MPSDRERRAFLAGYRFGSEGQAVASDALLVLLEEVERLLPRVGRDVERVDGLAAVGLMAVQDVMDERITAAMQEAHRQRWAADAALRAWELERQLPE